MGDKVTFISLCRGKNLYDFVKRNGQEGTVMCRVPPPEENLVIMNSTNTTGTSDTDE